MKLIVIYKSKWFITVYWSDDLCYRIVFCVEIFDHEIKIKFYWIKSSDYHISLCHIFKDEWNIISALYSMKFLFHMSWPNVKEFILVLIFYKENPICLSLAIKVRWIWERYQTGCVSEFREFPKSWWIATITVLASNIM